MPLSAQIELKLSLFSVNLNRLIVGKHRQDVISDSLLAFSKSEGRKALRRTDFVVERRVF